jgi:hypothetical protein
VQIKLWQDRRTGTVYAQAILPLENGMSVTIQAHTDARDVLEWMRRNNVQLDQVGSLFGSIGKFVKKVANPATLLKVVGAAAKVAASALPIAAPIKLALGAANTAAKLIKTVKQEPHSPKGKRAKLVLAAANAQAKAEMNAGRQLPLPTQMSAASPASKATFRYLVTTEKVGML